MPKLYSVLSSKLFFGWYWQCNFWFHQNLKINFKQMQAEENPCMSLQTQDILWTRCVHDLRSKHNVLFLLGIVWMLWIRNILGKLLYFKMRFHFLWCTLMLNETQDIRHLPSNLQVWQGNVHLLALLTYFKQLLNCPSFPIIAFLSVWEKIWSSSAQAECLAYLSVHRIWTTVFQFVHLAFNCTYYFSSSDA